MLCNLELEVEDLIKDTETNAIRGRSVIELIEGRKTRFRE